MASSSQFATPDSEARRISVKLMVNSDVYRGRLSLSDMTEDRFETAIRSLFPHHAGPITIDRYSDSSRDYIQIASAHSYRQLVRAAKAKSKLKFRVHTITPESALPTSPSPNPCVTVNTTVTVESDQAHSDYTPTITITKIDAPRPAAPEPVPRPAQTESSPAQMESSSPAQHNEPSRLSTYKPLVYPYLTTPLEQVVSLPESDSDASKPKKNEWADAPKNEPILGYVQPPSQGSEEKRVIEESLPRQPLKVAAISPCAKSVVYPKVGPAFQICCNACSSTIDNQHWHCSQCEMGDFDLCIACAEQGERCLNDEHWLIRRRIEDGSIVTSVSEVLSMEKPKPADTVEDRLEDAAEEKTEENKEEGDALGRSLDFVSQAIKAHLNLGLPSASSLSESGARDFSPRMYSFQPQSLAKQLSNDMSPVQRSNQWRTNILTCNNCVTEQEEEMFVHCDACADFDLCFRCFSANKHGHHPGHKFSAASENAELPDEVKILLAPGRNVRHSACCDACDKYIVGVRYKCLQCPDWDYCSACIDAKNMMHKGHQFVPLYEPLTPPNMFTRGFGSTTCASVQHRGIYCDGVLCRQDHTSSYISGVRYKCTICHDFDLCARCEASPLNLHSKSHPLIMMKTPISHVNVSTFGSDAYGRRLPLMGDKKQEQSLGSKPMPELSLASKREFAELQPSKPVAVSKPETPKPEASKTESSVKISNESSTAEMTTPYRLKTARTEAVRATFASRTSPVPAAQSLPSLGLDSDMDNVCGGFYNCEIINEPARCCLQVETGDEFSYSFNLRNTGHTAWPAGSFLQFVGGAYMGTKSNKQTEPSSVVYREVPVGGSATYTVSLRAGAKTGLLVSYWRLIMANGLRVGNRVYAEILVNGPKDHEMEMFDGVPNFKVNDGRDTEAAATDSATPDRATAPAPAPAPAPATVSAPTVSLSTPIPPPPAARAAPLMVFPTLETESPMSSVTQHASSIITEESTQAQSPTVVTQSELGSLADFDGGDEWTGSDIDFLTDEEYDILDNSDEDYSSL
ncbi:hypothetical protein TD95_000144 [Thielaviopsis punctulata]|uniref:ZZ-type domain-containing protein n=1 Tax=Thielaviopsis punctulata TaxID=72032 RepID=A0A0F4Z7X8_9PEZI|nr:hypothetical protein TD95_000144 [Thielaviopsis punctulata]